MKWAHKRAHSEAKRLAAEHEALANAALSPFRKILDEEMERARRAAGMVPEDEITEPGRFANTEAEQPSRQRKDCLRDAMEAAFDVLEAELGRSPMDSEMWGYLAERDATKYITDSSPDLITWRDWGGKKQTANKRNISDRLSRIIEKRKG